MAALNPGTPAPLFSLPVLDDGTFSLSLGTPTVLIFLKVECPTCQYAMPFFERLYAKYVRGSKQQIAFVGIAENDANDTREFVRRYGVTFPVLVEDGPKYAVSASYGLTNVPTAFLIAADGTIEFNSVGWARTDIDELARRIANLSNAAPVPLFQPGESVAEFKAG
jgi:peroxiredoxin